MRTRSELTCNKPQQTRLSFQPLPSSSPAKDSYSPAVKDRLASVRYQGAKLTSTSKTPSYKDNELANVPTPEPSPQPQAGINNVSSPPNAHIIHIKENSGSSESGATDGVEPDEDDIIVPSSKRRKISSITTLETPTRKSSRTKDLETPRSLRSSLRRAGEEDSRSPITAEDKEQGLGLPERSEDEIAGLVTQPTRRRRKASRAVGYDPFVESDGEVVLPRSGITSRIKPENAMSKEVNFVGDVDNVEYLSSDEEAFPPVKRRSDSRSKKQRRAREEQKELDEDLKDLQTSDVEEVKHVGRTRGGPVTTQRDRNKEYFELLKRRRAGEPAPRVNDSNDEDELGIDEDDGVDLDEIGNARPRTIVQISDDDDDDESSDEADTVVTNACYAADVEEDDFIVDDSDSQSANGAPSIPLAFTRYASSKPRELFRHVIEWLVKNKIAPAFPRTDELYTLSWNKINDQIKAQAGSRLISAAWNADFKTTLLARPKMQFQRIFERPDELSCDACNRTKHSARYEFKFTGDAYQKDTLEPIDDESDSEENEDHNDGASYDAQGHLLPSSSKVYHLGRFCAANAEMGHKFAHWKCHLNDSLLEYLEEQGVLSAEAIIAREKLNKKKREREAEHIVDLMEDTGMIDQMWRGLQDDLEDARFGMEDHVARGGKRNANRIGKIRVNRGDGRIEEWSEGGKMKVVVSSDSEGA